MEDSQSPPEDLQVEDYRPPAEKLELDAKERTGAIRKIFVITQSHLDIGFTKPPDQVARDYKRQIDTALRMTRENPDFRWTIESAWMLEEWLKRTDDPAQVEELGKYLREGRMGLATAFASMHSGVMAPEQFNRLVYQNDVPGFSWAFPRILQGSKVKYLVTGLNLGFGGGNSLGMGKNPFYWVGPDGSRVLTWFTNSAYIEGHFWKLANLAEAENAVPRRLAWLERNGYKYDAYLLMASVSDNVDPERFLPVLQGIREWNRKHPELPIQMALAEEFFAHLTQKYGDQFPEVRGDSSGHWDRVKLSAPELTGRLREAYNLWRQLSRYSRASPSLGTISRKPGERCWSTPSIRGARQVPAGRTITAVGKPTGITWRIMPLPCRVIRTRSSSSPTP